jgi:glycoside/pentoside/hexuronide:cation symporter, GPH family
MSSTPVNERIPLREKIAYALGGKAEYVVNSLALGSLVMPVLNIGYGLSPALIGVVLVVFRLWDAFTDPVMGNLSDNTRSRWGRRRPYIFSGALVCGLLLPFLYLADRSWSHTTIAIYFGIIGVLTYTAFTVWSMPYQSLGMELTRDYDERTRLQAWCSFVGIPVGLLGAWNFAFVSGDWFQDAATGEPDLVAGSCAATLIYAAVFVVMGLMPALFVKERFKQEKTVDGRRPAPEPLLASIKQTLRTGPLWALTGVVFFNLLGLSSISSLGYYLNIYYVNAGAIQDASIIEGWKQTGMVLLSLASVPFWTWFCARTDKKTALYVVLAATFVGHSLNYFCLDPRNPWLQLIPALFYSAISGSIWMIVPAMRMDVADYDELRSGRRREGSLASISSWGVKMSITLSTGLGGFVLAHTGFDVALKGDQPPEVLQRMFWVYLLLPTAFWTASLVCLSLFPLTRARMAEIRAELDRRHKAAANHEVPGSPT